MVNKKTLVKRAAETIFHVLGGKASRSVVTRLEPNIDPALVHLFSLRASAGVRAGTYESNATVFPPQVHDAPLTPHAKAVTVVLPTGMRATVLPQAGIRGGFSLRAEVRQAALAADMVCCVAEELYFKTSCIVRALPLFIEMRATNGRDASSLLDSSVTVNSSHVALAPAQTISLEGSLSFARAPLVHDVPEAIQYSVPLVRRREAPTSHFLYSDGGGTWALEKELLAAAAGGNISVQDVEVTAVFRQVPMRSISRLEIAPGGGSLNIDLRPGSGNRVQSVSRAMYSIAFGRIRGQNGVVRVLIPNTTD